MTASTSTNTRPLPDATQGTHARDDLIIPAPLSAGPYTVRLANNSDEITAAQALRYRVFYQEKQGKPSAQMIATQRDNDQWDEIGLHIIVIDTRVAKQPAIVGTLRLLHSRCLLPPQGFYTEQTFDLSGLKTHFSCALELSRFCIDSSSRGGAILMLIWKYAMGFIQHNNIPVMLGCASFSGTDQQQHLSILSYLYQHHLAAPHLKPTPTVKNYIDLRAIHQSKTHATWQEAQQSIPTLLRGYLKLGAKVSDAAIVDHRFNSIYVAIYVATQTMLQQTVNLVPHV